MYDLYSPNEYNTQSSYSSNTTAQSNTSHKLIGSAFSTHKPINNNSASNANHTHKSVTLNNSIDQSYYYSQYNSLYYNHSTSSPLPYYTDYNTHNNINDIAIKPSHNNNSNTQQVSNQPAMRMQYVNGRANYPYVHSSAPHITTAGTTPVVAVTPIPLSAITPAHNNAYAISQYQPLYTNQNSSNSNRRLKTPAQIRLLRQYYVKSSKPDNATVLSLVKQTGLTRDEIKRWFRNERFKVSRNGNAAARSNPDPSTPSDAQLDTINTTNHQLLNNKIDEHNNSINDKSSPVWPSSYNDTTNLADTTTLNSIDNEFNDNELTNIPSSSSHVEIQQSAPSISSVSLSQSINAISNSDYPLSTPSTITQPSKQQSQPFSYNNFSGIQLASAFEKHKQLTNTYTKSDDPSIDELAQSSDINDTAWRSLRRMLMPEAPITSGTAVARHNTVNNKSALASGGINDNVVSPAAVSSDVLDTFRDMDNDKRLYFGKLASFIQRNGMSEQVNQLGFDTSYRSELPN